MLSITTFATLFLEMLQRKGNRDSRTILPKKYEISLNILSINRREVIFIHSFATIQIVRNEIYLESAHIFRLVF